MLLLSDLHRDDASLANWIQSKYRAYSEQKLAETLSICYVCQAVIESHSNLVPTIFPRGKKGIYTMRFWVPDRFRSVEPRKDLFVSLKTPIAAEAMRVALVVQQGILASLNARLAGSQAEAGNDYYERLRDLALAHGFPYKPASELATGPLEDVLAGRKPV
jgi:hypothetical protein